MTEKQKPPIRPIRSKVKSLARLAIKREKRDQQVSPSIINSPNVEPLGSTILGLSEMPEKPHKSDGHDLSLWVKELKNDGEKIGWAIPHQYDDHRLIEGLKKISESRGVNALEYIRHSNRFRNLKHTPAFFDGLTKKDDIAEIPQSNDNLYKDGLPRRHEEGHRINLEYLRSVGIDPNYVLFFRVTQPATEGPKPEYYWTSDFDEVANSLFAEGSANGEPWILASTLEDISHNGGLILDVNDDEGIAVRQIGLASFDQSKALFSFPRYDYFQ
ncbi:MAG: hypothetical protein ACXWLH_00345 [Candidatus Saccharimonadales bacterium]